MPLRFISYHTAFIIALVAFFSIPYPSGTGTDEVIAATGFVRTWGYVCDRLDIPERNRRLGPIYRKTFRLPKEQEHDIVSSTKISGPRKTALLTSTDPAADTSVAMGSTEAPSPRTPVFFLSHGGPNVMFETEHPAYSKLQQIGYAITHEVKPKAVVVLSAHWQGEPRIIEVNTAEGMGLIYDYYGFPPEYYEVKYPNRGSPELANKILGLLSQAGIKAEGVRRGLDHGVFAGFRCAFDPDTNPLDIPIVQVSLFDSEDPDQHYALGRALSSLRSEGVQIVCSGMSVHSLRDMRKAMMLSARSPGASLLYATTFDEALKVAVEKPVQERQKAMAELLKRPDARQAHPTFDHLLPVFVAAGAAGDDEGRQTWTMAEGSMAWGQFRFG
ncbi:hypothetical protein LTR78_008601 [Recurvomyces mirabilis]|uniref:Extradiol ring-cleavage dioxygenase class III enzyme subunit B domain-containing protein n=1 Tax=Recurvomyces mirabilis TaxID=574656 RepID=A0AAE0WFN2_9PEZI|nr:hypothetical protein LTR78_008601 [Recurvomyces mirabilis]KAK5153487.1 hypothetical protein LTS14_007658 [Recurvomyces mirabilis]